MMWDNGHGMAWFGWLFMGALLILVVVGIAWLLRAMPDRSASDGVSAARRILDERFASGDLSLEEYEQRRRALH